MPSSPGLAGSCSMAGALPLTMQRLSRGVSRVPLRVLDFISTAPAPAPPARSRQTSKQDVVFASRAKFADHCPAWLKSSKIRGALDKHCELRELYKGDLSSIYEAVHNATGERVIIKDFPKDKLLQRPDLQQKVKLEWDIHAALDHPHIIRAFLAMETDASVGLFMELAGDSDAYTYVSKVDRTALREDDARRVVWDTLQALQHVHQQGIVHRDVKSENVFRTANGTWKLGVFGSALRLGDRRALERQPLKLEGTFSFAAPEYVEIWNGFTRERLIAATSFKLDSWSVGALAYDVLVGRAPFALYEGIPREDETRHILEARPEFPTQGLSFPAVSFIKQALEGDPQKRPTIRQLIAHPWFEADSRAGLQALAN